jgi:large subunit ribosomal protein L28
MCLVEESLTTVEASCSTLKVFRPIEKDGSGKIPILTGRGDFSANQTDSSRGEQVALGGHRPALQRRDALLCVQDSLRRVPPRPSVFAPRSKMLARDGWETCPAKNRLTNAARQRTLRSRFYIYIEAIASIALPPAMSKVCSITGSRVTRGSVIHRRGMAKKKGGVGRHVTKNVRREFHPNLHEHRVWVPELKKFVRIRVTARGLKTINKNGAYRALKKAGVIAG